MQCVVTGLRRYPVKSMGGESLESVELDSRGLAGDRWYAVRDAEGHFASGKNTRRFRRRDAVFEYAARTTERGVAVVRGDRSWTVGDRELDAELSDRMKAAVTVSPELETPHQDMGSISLVGSATLAWCADRWNLDADPRRLRVNLIIETSEPFVEETWQGKRAAIGEAEITFIQRCPRCRMIDIDQGGAQATGRWLKPLAAERDLCLGVYADVRKPGEIRVGSSVFFFGTVN